MSTVSAVMLTILLPPVFLFPYFFGFFDDGSIRVLSQKPSSLSCLFYFICNFALRQDWSSSKIPLSILKKTSLKNILKLRIMAACSNPIRLHHIRTRLRSNFYSELDHTFFIFFKENFWENKVCPWLTLRNKNVVSFTRKLRTKEV